MKTDIIKLLEEQSASPASGDGLALISLWTPGRRSVIVFTLATDQFATHFDVDGRFRFECLGNGCPACAVGLRATHHLYLPVWDIENRQIGMLYFSLGPEGPASRILQFLKTYKDQLAEVVAVIECQGQGKVQISARELLPNTDRGAIECDEFCKGLVSGNINLRSCVKRLSAEAIAGLSEIKRKSAPLVGGPVPPKKQAE